MNISLPHSKVNSASQIVRAWLRLEKDCSLGQDFYHTYARTRVERILLFFFVVFLPQTEENKQKNAHKWHFFFLCAKARLRETLVIFPSHSSLIQSMWATQLQLGVVSYLLRSWCFLSEEQQQETVSLVACTCPAEGLGRPLKST